MMAVRLLQAEHLSRMETKRLPTVDELCDGRRPKRKVIVGDASDFAAALLGRYRGGKVIEGVPTDGG